MWISDSWQDFAVLDCSRGEKLERWGKYTLVRPDPQAIWDTPRTDPRWRTADGRYSRSHTGGGSWDKRTLPPSWDIRYRDLTFRVKPKNFKHTGIFPEQAANWDYAMAKIRAAGRPVSVLNLFGYTGAATVACASAGASVCHVDAAKLCRLGREKRRRLAVMAGPSAGSWTTAASSSSGRSAAATAMTPSSWTAELRPRRGPGAESRGSGTQTSGRLTRAGVRRAVGRSALCHHQFLHHGSEPVGAHVSLREHFHPALRRPQ